MSEIPREPRSSAPSSPLLRPPTAPWSARKSADPTARIATAVEARDWATAGELLADLAHRPDSLASSTVETLERLATVPDLPPPVLGRLRVALGRHHERSQQLEAAESAYEAALRVDPTDEALLLLTRLRRRLRGPGEARELLWPHLAYEVGPAALFDLAASLALDAVTVDESALSVASDLLDQSRRLEPESAGEWAVRARLLLLSQRYEESVELARRLVPEMPSVGRVLLAAGLALTDRLDTDPGLVDAVLVDLPEEPWALAVLADLLVTGGRLEDAERVLTHTLAYVPADQWTTLRVRGLVRARTGRFDEAAADFTAAADIESDVWLTQMRGEVARLGGDPGTAVELLGSLPETDRPGWVWISLGLALRTTGALADAGAAFEHGLELDPDDLDAICGLAEIRLIDDAPESVEQARELLERALRLNPSDVQAIALSGEVHRREGRLEEAITWFSRALDLMPQYSWARGSRAQSYRGLGKLEAALADLLVAVQEAPQLSWISTELVDVLAETRPDEADEVLASLIATIEHEHPAADVGQLWIGRADLAARQERWADAERLYGRARRLVGDELVVIEAQLAALQQLQRFEDAIEEVDRLPAALRDELRWTRIDLLWSAGRLAEARVELERMDIDGSDVPSRALSTLGEAYRVAGRLDEARDLLTRAHETAGDDAWSLASLGALEATCGNIETARRLLQQAVELSPGYAFAESNLAQLALNDGDDETVLAILERTGGRTDAGLQAVRVNCLYGLGQYGRAWQEIEEFVAHKPHEYDLILSRGWVELALGRSRDAADSFVKASEGPTRGSVLLTVVGALLRADLWERAMQVVADNRSRGHSGASTAWAMVLFGAGLWQEAADAAVQGQREFEDSVDAVATSAQALRYAQRIPEALAESERLVTAAPCTIDYLVERASTLALVGRTEDAREMFLEAEGRLARKLHPDPDEQSLRGWTLLRAGRPAEAAELFLQTLTTTDLVATTLLNLIVARLLAGDHRQARVLLNRVGDELATLPGPRLRGVVLTAIMDIETARDEIVGPAGDLADESLRRLHAVVEALPTDLDGLMTTDAARALISWRSNRV